LARKDAKRLERTSAAYLKQAGFSLIYFLFGAHRCRYLKKNPLRLGVLPAVGRLCALTSFFLAKKESRKEIGEALSGLV